jgi:ribonuclease HII
LEEATINKKGAKVLTIKLREAQKKQEKAKPKFADWKNLTEEERKTLKEEAMAKAKEFYVIETSDESSSDSSIERGLKHTLCLSVMVMLRSNLL